MSDWEQRAGYRVKVQSKKTSKHSHKLSFFCPKCLRITSNLDDKYLKDYGFCADCYVVNVDGRVQPLVDIEEWRKKLEERNF